MFFKIKSNIQFRNYENYGYITDDRNFRYVEGETIGDRIVSESGACFLSCLTKEPQDLEDILVKVQRFYPDCDAKILSSDLVIFLSELEKEGFLCSGTTFAECDSKDYSFSYQDKKITRKYKPTNDLPETLDFLEKNEGKVSSLVSVHLEVTSRCNERCVHCYIPHDKKNRTLNVKDIFSILKQCRELNVLHVTISGGEPLLHPGIVKILRKCREYDFSVSVLTNLTHISPEIIEEMKKNKLLGVQTSLYSMLPAVHDAITSLKGSCEKTKQSILTLIKANVPMQINCPIMEQNKDSFFEVIEWAKELGIASSYDFSLIGSYDSNNGNLADRLTMAELKTILKKQIEKDKNLLNLLKKEEKTKDGESPEDPICSVGTSSLCISETGIVYPCVGWQSFQVGSIFENTLAQIWENSPQLNKLRALRKKDFPTCLNCENKSFCTMCMVRNANENSEGNYLNVNVYFCDLVKLKKELLRHSQRLTTPSPTRSRA